MPSCGTWCGLTLCAEVNIHREVDRAQWQPSVSNSKKSTLGSEEATKMFGYGLIGTLVIIAPRVSLAMFGTDYIDTYARYS